MCGTRSSKETQGSLAFPEGSLLRAEWSVLFLPVSESLFLLVIRQICPSACTSYIVGSLPLKIPSRTYPKLAQVRVQCPASYFTILNYKKLSHIYLMMKPTDSKLVTSSFKGPKDTRKSALKKSYSPGKFAYSVKGNDEVIEKSTNFDIRFRRKDLR